MATLQNPFGATAKPTAAGPTQMTVNQNSTTSGQLNNLLAGDSPYIAQARARAAQQSNARGLINSTMGAQAGEAAAINAAMPIAQSDASAYFNADQFNATNSNQFSRDENQFNRDDYMQGQTRAFQGEQAGLDRGQQLTLQGNELGFSREQLAQQASQAGLDRGQQLTLQGNELGFNREQLAQQSAEAGLDRTQQRDLQGQQLTFEQEQMARQQQFAGIQAGLDREQQTTLQEGEQNFRGQQSAFDRDLQIDLQKIDATTRQNLANIEADYKTLLQTSANSQELFRETSKNIAAIQLNEKLDSAAKKTLVEEQEAMLKNAMSLQGALSNLNLSSLVNF